MIEKRFLQLIDKYLLGTATKSEKQLLEVYLTRLEANNSIALSENKEEALKQAMWQQIQTQTTHQQEVPLVQVRWYKRKVVRFTVMAACIVGLLGIGLIFFYSHSPSTTSIVQQRNAVDSTQSVVRHVKNITGKEEYLQLPDSSWVVLAGNSEVVYKESFTSSRDITLIGKAYFKVTKDKTKPFTVLSGAVSTTALGTEFLVTAYEKSNPLTVRLYEGKVVVKALEKGDWRMKKDFYLNPGQEFVYSAGALAKLRSFKETHTNGMSKNDDLLTDDPLLPQNAKGSWYMFNNQSLGQVFDQLAFTYNTKIIYNKKDVQNKYFVGRFNKTDSLDIILNYITIVNKLKVAKKENAYYIIK